MIDRLGAACAICGSEPDVPHVDHDHRTGYIRGILCSRCNFGIGKFKDSVELLLSAVNYLQDNFSSRKIGAGPLD